MLFDGGDAGSTKCSAFDQGTATDVEHLHVPLAVCRAEC
jgi:hypothetical protein